jgi:hypothetical protein
MRADVATERCMGRKVLHDAKTRRGEKALQRHTVMTCVEQKKTARKEKWKAVMADNFLKMAKWPRRAVDGGDPESNMHASAGLG